MKKLIVDRIETEYVICTDDTGRFFAIPKEEAPKGVKKGDTLVIDSEGNISVEA